MGLERGESLMPDSLETNTTVSHYRILRKLGVGGMGEVYLAEDVKLGRKVALKVLPPDIGLGQDRMRRFVQEAKAASSLNHPNIAHIYEIGESNGINFIAMEFVEGATLRERIHDEKLDLITVLKYLVQVADGLAKAHAAGIVHRDLKPDNIMITRECHAKILDFGLAKLIEPAGQKPDHEGGRRDDQAASELATAILQQHSTPGVVLGTVGYMSPEQAQGKTKQIDHRSDIFSFGCILYEAVTGHKAFAGNDPIDTLNKIIREPFMPITDFRPDAPNHLQRIVRRCLAKDPEDRYQTIKDVAIELRELRRDLAGATGIDTTTSPQFGVPPSGGIVSPGQILPSEASTPSSQPPSSAEYIVSGIRQHKFALAVALMVLAAGAVGLGMYLHARNNEVAIESIAVLPLQNRSTDGDTEYLSDGLAESLIYRLSQLPNLKVSPTSSVFAYKNKEIDPVKVGNQLGVNAVLLGRIVQRGDSLTISAELVDVRYNKLLWGEQYERKMSELLQTHREIAREIVDKIKLKVSGQEQGLAKHYTESNEAYQLYLKGRFQWHKRTNEALKKSIDYFNQAIERDPSFALAYAGLADCYVVPAYMLPPGEKIPKAKMAAMKALELDDTLAEAHTSLARAMTTYDWDWRGAEREFQRAIELNPNYAIAHQWYCGYLEAMGRTHEAIAEGKRALELDPLSPIITFEMGLGFFYARDYDKAIEYYQKTLELDPDFPPAHGQLPAAYEQKRMYDQAITGFQKGTNLKGSREWYFSLSGLAHVYAVTGNKGEAQKLLSEMKDLSVRQYVPADRIALIYAGLGDKDEAFAWLEKGYDERSFNMTWLKAEPRWDSLRSDPRFADLVRRLGLPQ